MQAEIFLSAASSTRRATVLHGTGPAPTALGWSHSTSSRRGTRFKESFMYRRTPDVGLRVQGEPLLVSNKLVPFPVGTFG